MKNVLQVLQYKCTKCMFGSKLKKSVYFTIQFIFANIHEPRYTF